MPNTERRIVVLNTGSSSLKFAAYPLDAEAPALLFGAVEGIGSGKAQLKISGRASGHCGVGRRSA